MVRQPSASYRSPILRGEPVDKETRALGPTVEDLIPSYGRHLRAEGKTTATVDHTYLPALVRFDSFLARTGMPRHVAAIKREHVEAYIVSMQNAGKRPATVNLAYRSLQPFWRWCVEEGEIRRSPMTNMKPPAVPVDPPEVLREEQLEVLLSSCRGNDFDSRRDLALISLLGDTGMRRGEAAGLTVDSIDWTHDVVVIEGETSKSRRGRQTRFGKGTAKALDRYLRIRSSHFAAGSRALWLGKRGAMTGSGLLQVIERRGRAAGIEHLHPHLFRHTFAHHALRGGMQEGDLMQLAGWRDRGMLARYGASAAAERARDHYRSPLDALKH